MVIRETQLLKMSETTRILFQAGWCLEWLSGRQSDAELSTGRMDPRVGSGRVTILPDFGGSGRVSTSDFLFFFTDYFLVPKSMWIFEYYIRIDWFSTIFDIIIN